MLARLGSDPQIVPRDRPALGGEFAPQSLTLPFKRVYTLMSPSSPSFEACRSCACSALRRASRAVTQHYERHFRGSGLRVTQFTLLATLAQTGPLSISELSAKLGLERTTLSRNLRLIENRGWVSAVAHGDQRVRRMGLTPKGRKKAAAALAVWRRADASVEKVLRRFGLRSRPLLRTE
jgi:DNA-binding MarR family transcriptional regulator